MDHDHRVFEVTSDPGPGVVSQFTDLDDLWGGQVIGQVVKWLVIIAIITYVTTDTGSRPAVMCVWLSPSLF